MEQCLRNSCRIDEHVEVASIELPIGPAAVPCRPCSPVVSLAEPDVRTRCVRPAVHVQRWLLEEAEITRVELSQQPLAQSCVGDEVAKLLLRPLRKTWGLTGRQVSVKCVTAVRTGFWSGTARPSSELTREHPPPVAGPQLRHTHGIPA